VLGEFVTNMGEGATALCHGLFPNTKTFLWLAVRSYILLRCHNLSAQVAPQAVFSFNEYYNHLCRGVTEPETISLPQILCAEKSLRIGLCAPI
jgi:hypothetical protein